MVVEAVSTTAQGAGSRESEVGTPGAPSNCRKRKETGQGSLVTGSVCGRPAAC